MSQKNAMFSSILKKEDGRLVHASDAEKALYKEFVKNLVEGQSVEAFFDANKDDGTLAQLAKIHKCIRELAQETGDSFEDMKLRIKKNAGLCVKKYIEEETFIVCKSFSRCSKDELSLAIQAIIEIGDFVNINFR